MTITSTRDDRTADASDELRRIAQRQRALRRRIPSLAAAAALFLVSGATPETPDDSSSEGRKKGHMKEAD